jgi:hypothetical protein
MRCEPLAPCAGSHFSQRSYHATTIAPNNIAARCGCLFVACCLLSAAIISAALGFELAGWGGMVARWPLAPTPTPKTHRTLGRQYPFANSVEKSSSPKSQLWERQCMRPALGEGRRTQDVIRELSFCMNQAGVS